MKRPITAALLCASLVFASTAAPVHAKAPPPHKNAPQKTPPKLPKSKLLTHKSRFKTATSASLLQLKSKSLMTMGKSTQSLSVKSLKSGPAGTALGKLQPSKTKFDNAAMVSNKRMPGSLVSLNPQPLPPEPPPHEIKSMLNTAKNFKVNPGSLVSLNPQPLPPDPPPHEIKSMLTTAKNFKVNPGSLVSLNPQPLPPEPPPHEIKSMLKVMKGF